MSLMPLSSEPLAKEPFSVSAIAYAIKNTLEQTFGTVHIRGEISGAKHHSSGHVYFALKDDQAVLDGVCWRGTLSKLSCRIEDGMEVICTGRLSSYPLRSKYQMVVEQMTLAGEGALLKLLEDRRRKLALEGLFDLERKKPLPFIPKTIGIITSPTGAVIKDILHRLQDRFPCSVLLWPVAVQGETAAEEIANAILGFNHFEPRPDLLIVARGGGSLEDLWAFNEEIVVRAAAGSTIPLISAVGHETDTTLIDFASDWRAPTPTAAAERAVPVRQTLVETLQGFESRLQSSFLRGLEERAQRLDELSERFLKTRIYFFEGQKRALAALAARLRHPRDLLAQQRIVIETFKTRLDLAMKNLLERHNRSLSSLGQLLESYSFNQTLKRGFCLVRTKEGVVCSTGSQLADGQTITLTFQDCEKGALISS